MIGTIVMLSGCSSKSNFYQLHTSETAAENKSRHITRNIVGVAKVEVAEYLDKPQVVTRLSEGELKLHETQRWAGSFADNIQRVLTYDLSRALPSKNFIAAPWEEPLTDRHRIYLTVDRFDGDANGTVTLEGRWSLVDREEDRLVTGEKIYLVGHGSPTVSGIVSTQSRMLEQLSRSMAAKLRRYL